MRWGRGAFNTLAAWGGPDFRRAASHLIHLWPPCRWRGGPRTAFSQLLMAAGDYVRPRHPELRGLLVGMFEQDPLLRVCRSQSVSLRHESVSGLLGRAVGSSGAIHVARLVLGIGVSVTRQLSDGDGRLLPAGAARMKLHSRRVAVPDLTTHDHVDMFTLFARYYDSADWDRFESDLAGKQWVIQLIDPATGILRGFSTQVLWKVPLAVKP